MSWRRCYIDYISRRKASTALTVRDLVIMDEQGYLRDSSKNNGSDNILPDVMNWCKEFDALGSLIWMALPFEQWRRKDGMAAIW